MRRIGLSCLMMAGLGATLISCGDGGSLAGGGPAGAAYGVGDDPYSNGNDPPPSLDEPAGSFTEAAPCGLDEVVSLSDMLLLVGLPICEFATSCGSSDSPSPPPEEPEPMHLGSSTRAALEFDDIPSFCLEMVIPSDQDDLFTDECRFYKELAHVAKTNPACEQWIALPRGYCLSRFQQCVREVKASGCGRYLAEELPASCDGLEDSEEEAQPGTPQDDF